MGKGSHKVILEVVDTAIEERRNIPVPNRNFCYCDMFILVFSVIFKESFEAIKNLRERILKDEEWADYAMIVAGTKCDLRNNDNINSDLNMNDVIEWCQEQQMPYIETSAKNGKNVYLLFRQSVYEYILYNDLY